MGSNALCMPTGNLERYFSVLLYSLHSDARLLLRLRKLRIFRGISSKSDGVFGREVTAAALVMEVTRSTELAFEDVFVVFKVMRQL